MGIIHHAFSKKRRCSLFRQKSFRPERLGGGIDFRHVVMKGVTLSVDLNISLLKKISFVNRYKYLLLKVTCLINGI